MWYQRGAKKDSQEIWHAHEGQIVAPTSLLNILIADVHGFDHCARGGGGYLPSSITRVSREIEWNHQGQTEQNM